MQAQANDSNPWLDKDGALLFALSAINAPPTYETPCSALCVVTNQPPDSWSVLPGNPVGRFDAIIMDRPWLWHWKKAFIFIPVQGLLIATGALPMNRSVAGYLVEQQNST